MGSTVGKGVGIAVGVVPIIIGGVGETGPPAGGTVEGGVGAEMDVGGGVRSGASVGALVGDGV